MVRISGLVCLTLAHRTSILLAAIRGPDLLTTGDRA